ncbi:hypothetical protein [Calothrix sp. NIES-2098]|uniref:hypothetical protein n=1 Tax=Calothrix sp. NIES-2098 TaxID=1954171 RepID=UPI000B5DE1BE|nr:hypothetical protein NIES2098_17690 [Calothrix sp. NIES-2098]
MTLKASKTLSLRTEKELAFFLEQNTIPLTQALWEWIALQGKIGTQIEIDLRDFEQFVTKHRGTKFARWWLLKRFKWLIQHRVIQVIKEFSSTAYRILLRPFDWLKPRKKNQQNHLQNLNSTCDLNTSNEQSARDGENNNNTYIPKISSSEREELNKILQVVKLCEQYGYQPSAPIFDFSLAELKASLEQWSSQQYEELERRYDILVLCAEYGIYYHPNKAGTQELFNYHIEEIELALKHFIQSGGFEKRSNGKPIISNPQGWLIRCLQQSWWEQVTFGIDQFLSVINAFLPKNIPRDYS